MIKTRSLIVIFLIAMVFGNAYAGVTPEEAALLKTELTPLGGERGGNKDGTIPAWDGGYTTVPEGYKSGEPRHDPFADEKPLFSITAANMDQYADKLDEATLLLLKKYPDTYRLDIYPTHRTMSAPEWSYDETFKNATRATLDGYELKNAFGGIPFPIPKNGEEVMWNHEMRLRPVGLHQPFTSWIVDESGTPAVATIGINETNNMFLDPKYSYEILMENGGLYGENLQSVTYPPFRAGEFVLFLFKFDNTNKGYQYLVGQRRVRRAPTICCDTPNFVNSGVDFFDQPYVFLGEFKRYDWKILNKREMYIPYNCNQMVATPDLEVLGPHHLNPGKVRWELHRVWELEGKVREGQRDVRPRRKMYVEEDGWIGVIGNTWDAKGNIWHQSLGFPQILYEVPCVTMDVFFTADIQRGQYTYTGIGDMDVQLKSVAPYSLDYFSPAAVVRRAVR